MPARAKYCATSLGSRLQRGLRGKKSSCKGGSGKARRSRRRKSQSRRWPRRFLTRHKPIFIIPFSGTAQTFSLPLSAFLSLQISKSQSLCKLLTATRRCLPASHLPLTCPLTLTSTACCLLPAPLTLSFILRFFFLHFFPS